MRTLLAVVALAVTAVGLAACSATTTTAGAPASVSLPSAAAAVHTAPAADKPDGSAAHPLPWGATYHGQNFDVTVSAPSKYTPSDSAFVDGSSPRAVAVTVTVVNHSDKSLNPMGDLSITGTAGTAEAQDVEDSANNVDEPTADLLPGHTLSWKQAFGIPKTATDLAVDISIGFGAQTLYFTGPLG